MSSPLVLDVALYGRRIGTLTLLPGDQTLFVFEQEYVGDQQRPALSLSFKDVMGELITDIRRTRSRLPPFFSNLLPEGALLEYLATKTGINPRREFFLLWMLGEDLPGAITIRAADGTTPQIGIQYSDRKWRHAPEKLVTDLSRQKSGSTLSGL